MLSPNSIALMKNSFGNFVVQKALALAEGEAKEELAMVIEDNIPQLSEKKLKTKWTDILNKSLSLVPNASSPGKSYKGSSS